MPWLRDMAMRGGKGVVNNIDARALGRIAHNMDITSGIIRGQQARILELEELLKAAQKSKHGYIANINL